MSMIKQELKGTTEQLAGKAKQTVGKLLDDPAMQAAGETREALGHARVEVAEAAGRVKGQVQRAAKAVLQGISTLAASTAAKPKTESAVVLIPPAKE